MLTVHFLNKTTLLETSVVTIKSAEKFGQTFKEYASESGPIDEK